MKRILTSLAIILLLSLTVQAQDNKRPRFNPEEFKARMEAYIAQKAGLSQSESEKVFPIFHEMKAKQRELLYKENKLKRSIGFNEPEKAYRHLCHRGRGTDRAAAEADGRGRRRPVSPGSEGPGPFPR